MLDIDHPGSEATIRPLDIVRRLGEYSSDAVIATDADGVLSYANAKTTDLFGWATEELIGQSLSALIPDRFRGSHHHHVDEFVHGKEANRHLNPTELTGVRSDGTEFPAAVALSRVVDGDDLVLYASIRDMTTQVDAARVLAASERRLKSIFDGAAVALWEQDFSAVGEWLAGLRNDGIEDIRDYLETHPNEVGYGASLIKVQTVNPAGAALEAAIPAAGGTGDAAPSWMTPSVLDGLIAQFGAVWDNTPHVRMEMAGQSDPDSLHHLIVHWDAPQHHGELDLSSVVVSALDITPRVTAEVHLETVQAQLRQAQKLEAIGQLAAGVAHEINTPIQYVNDNAGFLSNSFESLQSVLNAAMNVVAAADSGPVSAEMVEAATAQAKSVDYEFLVEEIPEAFNELIDGIQRVSKIVAALKKFSHPGTDEKVPEDVNRIVEDSLSVSANEWKHHATVVTDFADGLPLVPCMANEMSQVVINIVVNAAHAIAGHSSGAPGQVTIRTGVADEVAFIEIADDGPGVPEEIQERIFEPFFTTKDVGHGTGQGLSLAHRTVVDQHQGQLSLRSEPGKGATFRIELPLQAPPSES